MNNSYHILALGYHAIFESPIHITGDMEENTPLNRSIESYVIAGTPEFGEDDFTVENNNQVDIGDYHIIHTCEVNNQEIDIGIRTVDTNTTYLDAISDNICISSCTIAPIVVNEQEMHEIETLYTTEKWRGARIPEMMYKAYVNNIGPLIGSMILRDGGLYMWKGIIERGNLNLSIIDIRNGEIVNDNLKSYIDLRAYLNTNISSDMRYYRILIKSEGN